MLQFAIVAAAAIVALVVGWAVQKRRPDRPLATSHAVPDQVDRADFVRPDASWLVAVFTSDSCATCARVWQSAQLLIADEVAVQELEAQRDAELHERYAITAVPSVVIADRDGVTRSSFLGPPSSTELWATMAELRQA